MTTKIRRCLLAGGSLPVYKSNGIWSVVWCGRQILRYTAWINKNDQYFEDDPTV
jgi:hypothetical protein